MILVTGGAGFIGSHLLQALLKQGDKVRILDNLSTGEKENLQEVSGHFLPELSTSLVQPRLYPLGEKAEFIFGDISDLNTCRSACQGVSHVFHQAALGSVQRSIEDPLASHQANATGTLNILQAARENGVKRVIYASSSSVYGNIPSEKNERMPKNENLPPQPQSPYAATKLIGETYCRLFAGLYGLETVSLRYFNVFGPRQNARSVYAAVVPQFITALQKNQPPIIFGDGNQSRDFTFVANVVQANLRAMEAPGISGRVFNVAGGKQTTVNTLLAMLQEISGRSISPQYQEPRPGEVRHSLASIESAKSHLGYAVETDLREGLFFTWEWYQKKGLGR